MIRLLATTSLAALLLAACAPEAAGPAKPEAEVAVEPASVAAEVTAPADFQLEYLLESENYTVQSSISQAILDFDPALAYRLWTANKAALDALGVQADGDKASADTSAAESGGESWFMGYSLSISQSAALVVNDTISISDTTDTFTGGAHPNYFLGGEIYRKGEETPLDLAAFITDEAAFNELVIKALTAEKLSHGFESDAATVESSLREILVPSPEIPEVYKGRFVLAPSTEPGKAGGITVMFSPYDVGSYAEGAYTVTVPADELAPILTETWAGHFGGDPVVGEDAEEQ